MNINLQPVIDLQTCIPQILPLESNSDKLIPLSTIVPIILGKKGITIKRIRESSQKEIENIFNTKIHLYLEVIHIHAK